MGKSIIGIMNGAFSSYRSKDNVYMSDIVEKIVESIKFPNGYELFFQKGGLWDTPDRNMKEWLIKHDKAENNLLIVTKSGGAWDFSKPILKDFMKNCLYTKRLGIMIDGTFPFRIKPLAYNGFQKIINFYQPNGFLHGGPCKIENENCDLEEYKLEKIGDKKIDHFNIIYSPFVEQKIREALSEVLI